VTARVATYARVRKLDGRRVTNLDGRQRRLQAIVARTPGCVVVAAYADVGETWRLHRPGLGWLLADAAARRFDALVVEDVEQLAEEPAQLRALLAQFAAVGVVVRPLTTAVRRSSAAGWAAVAFVELLGD
jgi:DNA invertase Pin-like site-specific DNA recombinase